MRQSELEANTCSRHKAREMLASKTRLVLVLLLIGWENGAKFLSVAMQNQSICETTLGTRLRTFLLLLCLYAILLQRVRELNLRGPNGLKGQLTTAIDLLTGSFVHQSLSGAGPFTLFLMVDSAFANLTQEQVKLVIRLNCGSCIFSNSTKMFHNERMVPPSLKHIFGVNEIFGRLRSVTTGHT